MPEITLTDKRFTIDPEEVATQLPAVLQMLREHLPLQALCNQGGFADTEHLSLSILSVEHQGESSRARVSVFFEEVVGGCNCHDDPHRANMHGLLSVSVDRKRGSAVVGVVDD